MLRVRLEPDGVELALPERERLLDALDEQPSLRTALPSACRAGNCGACRVRVLDGNTLLAPPDAHERRTLQELAAGEDERLGCQLHAADRADGRVVLLVIAA